MKSIKFILLVGVLALLPLLAGGGKAQTSNPEGVTSPSGAVEAAVSYQGVLTAPDGTPLSGTYDLEFTFWSADSGGWQMGPATSRFGETITNGLYSTKLEVAPAIFNGQEAWLRIRVRETGSGTWEILDPRVQVLPTAYALGLRPEARIVGDVNVPNAIVMATNTSSGWGLRGESTEPTGYGVYGYNGSFSPAAYGGGVIGVTRTDGYGVRGEAPSSGDFSYGGYFTGRIGVRAYGQGTWTDNGYAGYFLSAHYRGIYVYGAEGWYDGYFAGVDGVYSAGGYSSLRADRTLVVNGGDEALEPGDVVAISGIAEPLMAGGEPLLAVHKASGAADTAVVGVVAEAMLVQEVERPEDPLGQKSIDVQPVEGNVLPGGYLAIVTNGLVPAVKVSGVAAESLRIGDLLSPASAPGKVQRAESQYSPGTILGKVAGPYDPKTGTVPVFVILQ
jgi:hypothetical protein